MCGMLALQKLLSSQIGQRAFLLRPPEPSPELLISSPSDSIYIGRTKFLHVPFFWDSKKLVNPHVCVVGITGSGKSFLVKTFITRANIVLGTSALILDWSGEYVEWVRAAGGTVISFGKEGINLLDTGGMTPHGRARQVIEALEILTDISSFPKQRRLTENAIEKAYISKGYKLHSLPASGKRLPSLEDVYSILKKQGIREADAAEAARRVNDLLSSSGKSFSHSTIRLEDMMKGLVCVDLHSLPRESIRSLAGLAILQFVKEKMRLSGYVEKSSPSLFIVVDEAWKIASDSKSDVVSIVREGRKYGFGLIVASQNPSDVHKSIFSNAGTTFCFRLTSAKERKHVRSSLAYSDYFELLTHSMSVGQALVHLEFARPVLCPRTFLVEKVEGEALLEVFILRGDSMVLEFEKGSLLRKLLSFGLTDRQANVVVSEFEKRNYSLDAAQFVAVLEKFGYSRASTISLLRELGADEKDILGLFSSLGKEEIDVLVTVSESPASTVPTGLAKGAPGGDSISAPLKGNARKGRGKVKKRVKNKKGTKR